MLTETRQAVIREAEARDHDGIWNIYSAVMATGDTLPFPPVSTRAQALAFWIDVHPKVFVAIDRDRIVGSYFLRPIQPGLGSHVCNCGYMVSPDARRRGLGSQLCRHSLKTARELGFRAMQFNLVVSTNTAGVCLWKRMGFKTLATLPEAFNHKTLGFVDAYVMHQPLRH